MQDPVGHRAPTDVEALVKRVQYLERLLSDNVSQRQADHVSSGNLGPGTDLSVRGSFYKGRLYGQSHYANMNFLVPVCPIVIPELSVEMFLLLFKKIGPASADSESVRQDHRDIPQKCG